MINIQNPCSVKWESMTPTAGGSYCETCCKIVVDFSECSNEEIANYFSANAGKKNCGRFLNSQVIKPKYKNRIFRFAAAAVLVFSGFLFSSCGNKMNEEHITGDSFYMPDSIRKAREADSVHRANVADSINKSNPNK